MWIVSTNAVALYNSASSAGGSLRLRKRGRGVSWCKESFLRTLSCGRRLIQKSKQMKRFKRFIGGQGVCHFLSFVSFS